MLRPCTSSLLSLERIVSILQEPDEEREREEVEQAEVWRKFRGKQHDIFVLRETI